jgi:hypothetical protein
MCPQAIAVDVVEAEKLLRALQTAIRRALAPRMADPGQPNAGDRPQLQRPPLAEPDHRSAVGPPLVDAEDARFFAWNVGSGDYFHVLSRRGVTPSRRSTRRTHSSVIAGNSCWH